MKLIVGDFKLNLRQLNLLMGIKGFNLIKFRATAAADLGLNRHDFRRLKQLLTMPAMALLATALSLPPFLFALWLLKRPIGRWRLIGVLGIAVNPLLQFFGMPHQLGYGTRQLKDALFQHLNVAAHGLGRLKPFDCGKWPLNFHSRVFSTAKTKNLAIFSIISRGCMFTRFIAISTGYNTSQLPVVPL